MAVMARCSTTALIIMMIALFSVAFPSVVTVSGQATGAWLVGGEASWNSPGFDYQAWADRKTFHIGDELLFVYDQGFHDVVVADTFEAFDQCQMQPNLGVYDTGLDSLVMNDPGTYYFMCSFNCQANNMKFKVTPIY